MLTFSNIYIYGVSFYDWNPIRKCPLNKNRVFDSESFKFQQSFSFPSPVRSGTEEAAFAFVSKDVFSTIEALSETSNESKVRRIKINMLFLNQKCQCLIILWMKKNPKLS